MGASHTCAMRRPCTARRPAAVQRACTRSGAGVYVGAGPPVVGSAAGQRNGEGWVGGWTQEPQQDRSGGHEGPLRSLLSPQKPRDLCPAGVRAALGAIRDLHARGTRQQKTRSRGEPCAGSSATAGRGFASCPSTRQKGVRVHLRPHAMEAGLAGALWVRPHAQL